MEEIKIDLKFTIKDDRIFPYGTENINTGSLNYYRCLFDFCSAWNGLSKFAVFKSDENFFGPVLITDGSCAVPSEVTQNNGNFFVGAYGSAQTDGSSKRISTGWCRISVSDGAYSADTTAPGLPSPDIWEEYMDYLSKTLENSVPKIASDGNWLFWDPAEKNYSDSGKPSRGVQGEQGPKGDAGEPGYTPVKGVDYWTDSDKAEISETISEEVSQKTASKADKSELVSIKDELGNEIEKKQDKLIFDNTPVLESENPVKSGGIKTSLDKKRDISDGDVIEEILRQDYEGSNPSLGFTNTIYTSGVRHTDPLTTAEVTRKLHEKTTNYIDTRLLEKADIATLKNLKLSSVPHTSVSGYPITITDQLAGEKFIELRVYGNSIQSKPDIDNPSYIAAAGDLVSDGEYSGKYKISVKNCGENEQEHTADAYIDTPLDKWDYIDLSSAKRKTRTVKYVCTGQESWFDRELKFEAYGVVFRHDTLLPQEFDPSEIPNMICSHFSYIGSIANPTGTGFVPTSTDRTQSMQIKFSQWGEIGLLETDTPAQRLAKFKSWLADEYAKGTPVTIWYAAPEYTDGNIISEGVLKTTGSSADTLTADTITSPSELYAQYYQDINKVLNNLKNALLSQGGNV